MRLIVALSQSAALLIGASAATSTALAQANCADISGQWSVTETITATCTVLGQTETLTESGSGRVSINQTGCSFSYRMPGTQVIRTGTVSGRTVRINTPLATDLFPGAEFSEVSSQIEGTLQGDTLMQSMGQARLRGTFQGVDFSCSATSRAQLIRDHSDFVVSRVTASRRSLQTDQPFTINATVRNNGNTSSSRTTLRYFRSTDSTITRGDKPLSTDVLDSLPPGGSTTRSRVVAIDGAGTFWIGACVDPVAGESLTTNNCSTGVKVTVCYNAAVAIFRGGPQTLEATAPHNVALASLKARVLASGGGSVAAEVFDVTPSNPRTAAVASWLDQLNEGCAAPVPTVFVGHSLGGDAAIRVNYEKVCSRILLDPFDPRLTDPRSRAPILVQRGGSYPPREPPGDGAIYSFLADQPDEYLGRPLIARSNVSQQCVDGTDHNSIVTTVIGTGAFQSTIVGTEIRRCAAADPAPVLGQYQRCASETAPILSILPLLLDDEP